MSLLTLIFVLVLIGVLLWAINTYIPMDPKIKKILNVAVVVIVVLWLMYVIGLLPLGDIKVPRVR
jgi:bacteriorhodopsin